jgi:hypothetical protein
MIIAQQASHPIAALHGALRLNLYIHEGTGGHCPFPDDALSCLAAARRGCSQPTWRCRRRGVLVSSTRNSSREAPADCHQEERAKCASNLKVDDACHHGKAGGQSGGEEHKHPEPALRHQREAANNETATIMPSIAPAPCLHRTFDQAIHLRHVVTQGYSIAGARNESAPPVDKHFAAGVTMRAGPARA